MADVSVIVLFHNGLAGTTAPCLESLFSTGAALDFEVVAVDNGSSDGTPDHLVSLAAREPRLRCVLNDVNRGFAGGMNDGIRAASGDILVLLNDDTLVTDGWLDGLAAALRGDPSIGLAGPVTNASGNEQRIHTTGRTPREIVDEGLAWAAKSRGDRFRTERLGFFCVATTRDVVERVGLLDEEYGRGFYEDDDYCVRATRAGHSLVCLEDIFVYHRGSASFGKAPGDTKALLRRNRARLEAKLGAPYRPRHPRDRQLDLAESYLRCLEAGDDPGRMTFKISNRLRAARESAPRGAVKRFRFERRLRGIVRELARRAPGFRPGPAEEAG